MNNKIVTIIQANGVFCECCNKLKASHHFSRTVRTRLKAFVAKDLDRNPI